MVPIFSTAEGTGRRGINHQARRRRIGLKQGIEAQQIATRPLQRLCHGEIAHQRQIAIEGQCANRLRPDLQAQTTGSHDHLEGSLQLPLVPVDQRQVSA